MNRMRGPWGREEDIKGIEFPAFDILLEDEVILGRLRQSMACLRDERQ